MITFAIGIIILLLGGFLYSKFVEKVFQPDDRPTPAVAIADGVDYVVMPEWKNSLIELLNIAGTGPVLGPIQGILFGPIAFLVIPIGNIIAGSTHDYICGMVSMRNKGAQMPGLVRQYLGKGAHKVYLVILMVLMLLVGAVFVYTPGDLIVGSLMKLEGDGAKTATIVVYTIIFLYYLASTYFPIDAIIGKIYPIFGAILIVSAVGIFIGTIMDGGKNLTEVWNSSDWQFLPKDGSPFIPVFFITVACGILSGFHASQAALVSRTVKNEYEGRKTFYMMMVVEGFIAMCWAAGAMILLNRYPELYDEYNATAMVSTISKEFLGNVGGILAILGVIVLPITSGDTAFRSLRLMVAEQFHIDQQDNKKRFATTIVLFIPAVIILIFAKTNADGFNLLWRYFAFTNQLVAVFGLALCSVYLLVHDKHYIMTMVPMAFYLFVVSSFILHAPIGFGIEGRLLGQPDSYTVSYILGAVITVIVLVVVRNRGVKKKAEILAAELENTK